MEDPIVLLALLAGSLYVGRLWLQDLAAARAGRPNPQALPGATIASPTAIVLAAVGSLLLLAAEVAGEYQLGLVGEQRKITWLYGLYSLAAAFLEELIFRGFIVVTQRGRAALVASCVGASLVFAAVHPFLWDWKDGALVFQFTTKAWFSTGMIFAGSLWFYLVRFWKLNPTHSLWPCIAAHAAKNLGVFAVKYAQGFVGAWW